MAVKTFSLFSQKQSPKDYDRRKQIAQLLMEGDGKPMAYNTAQGLAIAAPKILGGLLGKMADDNEQAQEDEAWGGVLKAMTGGLDTGSISSPLGSSGSRSSTAGRSDASSDDGSWATSGDEVRSRNNSREAESRAAYARQKYEKMGYSPHAAQGIVDNLMHESGLDTKVVGDKGTAFGVAQWRGDRFANLKTFAKQTGRDWRDLDTQLEFVDHEMKNGLDEGAKVAYAKLQQAQDPDSAYNAFVEHYERPSAENLRRRWRGGEGGQAPSGGSRMRSSSLAPEAPEFDTSFADQQINAGLAMMRNPRTREAGFRMYQQGISTKAQLRQQATVLDYQGRREALKYQREREDKLADEERKEGLKTYTLSPGQRVVDAEGKLVAEGAPKGESQGLSITYDEAGRPIVQMGGSGKPPTEMNQKYEQFFIRSSGANKILDRLDTALAKPEAYIAEYGPKVASDYLNSEEYKLAKQSADEFLSTIIRPDTGAALTDKEFDIYGQIFLPRPNDTPAIIAQKRESRVRAIEALKAGMKPEQVLRQAAPDLFDGASTVPKGVDPETANVLLALQKRGKGDGDPKPDRNSGPGKYQPGYTEGGYRFKGGDPTKSENWEKLP